MHKQMMVVIPGNQKAHTCEIFGYSTRGIPGLEVVGFGGKGKSIKEKFIYFNKRYKLSIPPRRFVLCVEDQTLLNLKEGSYRWLELPFLIMYWSMAGILPIENLSNCLCSGTIAASGLIETLDVEAFLSDEVGELIESGYQVITKGGEGKFANYIPVEEIISLPQVT